MTENHAQELISFMCTVWNRVMDPRTLGTWTSLVMRLEDFEAAMEVAYELADILPTFPSWSQFYESYAAHQRMRGVQYQPLPSGKRYLTGKEREAKLEILRHLIAMIGQSDPAQVNRERKEQGDRWLPRGLRYLVQIGYLSEDEAYREMQRDWITETYQGSCAVCLGAGWVMNRMHAATPTLHEMQRCPKCGGQNGSR